MTTTKGQSPEKSTISTSGPVELTGARGPFPNPVYLVQTRVQRASVALTYIGRTHGRSVLLHTEVVTLEAAVNGVVIAD